MLIKNSVCTRVFYDTQRTILQTGNPPNTLFCSSFFFREKKKLVLFRFLIEADNVGRKDVAFALSILLILHVQRELLKCPWHVHRVGHPSHPQEKRPSEQRNWVLENRGAQGA